MNRVPYPEVSFTAEWKEGVIFEREAIFEEMKRMEKHSAKYPNEMTTYKLMWERLKDKINDANCEENDG